MDLMTTLDAAVALGVALLILIALYALSRLIGLIDGLVHDSKGREENETELRDVQQGDGPGA